MQKVKRRNGVRYSSLIKQRAKDLRLQGKTHREIAEILRISLGSADLWTKGILLSKEQKREIQKRRTEKVYTPELRRKLARWAIMNGSLHAKYNRENLVKKIKDFYALYGRIPLKKEFNMYHEYQSRFGSWNNAIKAAGFKPNPLIFAYKFSAKDGHRCDSFTEKIIDDWLYEHHVFHERNRKYGNTKMTADFSLNKKIILEFFGLAGVQEGYDAIIKRKRELCDKLNIQLVEVYPKDIIPKNRLSEIITSVGLL